MELTISPELIEALNAFLNEYKIQISGFLGLTILTCLFSFVYHLSKLGVSGTNKNSRSDAMKGIIITGVGLSVLGSLSVWFYLIVGTSFIN